MLFFFFIFHYRPYFNHVAHINTKNIMSILVGSV